MDKKVKIPYINPVDYTLVGYTQLQQYVSKHMDDFPFENTIRSWQQTTRFYQPWMLSENIRQQIRSELYPVTLEVLDINSVVKHTVAFDQLQQNEDNPGEFIYQSDLALNIFQEGCYFLRIKAGNNGGNPVLQLISNPMYFGTLILDTLSINFKDAEFYEDVVFQTGYNPTMRVYGDLFPIFGSTDTIGEDMKGGKRVLRSKPITGMELQFGGVRGMPDNFSNKMNRILGCSNLVIDGRRYSKQDGSSLEEKELTKWPMRGWAIELAPYDNTSSKVFTATGVSTGAQEIVITVDDKGFNINSAGGADQQVTAFE